MEEILLITAQPKVNKTHWKGQTYFTRTLVVITYNQTNKLFYSIQLRRKHSSSVKS